MINNASQSQPVLASKSATGEAEPSAQDRELFFVQQVVERLAGLGPSDRAIVLAEQLEASAAIYRAKPFAVTVSHKTDEESLDAVRQVAQLARTVAKSLRDLAAIVAAADTTDRPTQIPGGTQP